MARYGYTSQANWRRRRARMLAGASVPPITFTAPMRSATRFGPENNVYALSNANTTVAANGTSVLGPSNTRAIQLNTPNMPASGDFFYAMLIRTQPSPSAEPTRLETLLSVDGQGATGGNGGQLAFKSAGVLIGSNSTGQTLDSSQVGRFTARRQSGAPVWQWWPQTTLGAYLPNVVLVSDTAYLLLAGTEGAFPKLSTCDLSTLTVQSATGTTAQAASRPTAPLFNLLGAGGSATGDRQGFGGDVAELVVINGTYPTAAQIQAAAAAADPASLAAAVGGALVYHNRLDYSAAASGSLASVVGNNATILANSIGFEATRGFKRNGVVLDRLGPRWLFPLAIGGASAKVWFEGSAPAGATVVCFLRYLDGTSSAQVRATADGTGRFVASIISAKAKPFYRSAGNLADLTDCHNEFDVMDVGIVIPWNSQSEGVILFSSAWTGATDLTPVAANNSGLSATAGPEGGNAGRWAVVHDQVARSTSSQAPRRVMGCKARPDRMIGKGMWADGAHEMAKRVIADTGCSVMFVMLGRSGHVVDNFIFDNITFTQSFAITGSGTGPYTSYVKLTDQALRDKFGPTGTAELSSTDAAKLYISGNFYNQVRPGTFRLDLGGGVVITDTKVSDSQGTLSGPGGITGTIQYVSTAAQGATAHAAISLTFPSTPASTAGTLTWKPKCETLDGSSANKTTYLNGYGVFECFEETAKLGLRYGWTETGLWWLTGNITDGPSNQAIRDNVTQKYKLLRNRLKGYVRAGVDAELAGPTVEFAKGRDTNNAANYLDNARVTAEENWANETWSRMGGHNYDFAVDQASSPHETYGDTSGKRLARRMGYAFAAHFLGTYVPGPKFRTGAANRSGDGTILTVPLASIGSGLTLSISSGGNSNALDQWYVGGTLIPNDATTIARLRSDSLAVELVKLSGTWATGAESNVLYVSGAPGIGTAPPASLLYDNRGGFGGFEAGMLAHPKLG